MSRVERAVLGLLWLVAGSVLFALYAPAILVVVRSFFDTRGNSIDWETFGLQWYRSLLSNQDILAALGNSLVVGVAAVAAATSFAVGLAYYMKTGRRRGRAFVETAIFLPFVLPPIVTGISLLIACRELGIESSLLTVTVGHTALILAIIYRMVTVRMEGLEDSQIEASLDLGANHSQTFFLVVLPQLRSVLVTSALLAFTLSFDETLVSFFLVGSDMTLPIRLWSMLRVGFSPEVNAFATVVLLATAAMTVAGALSLKNEVGK